MGDEETHLKAEVVRLTSQGMCEARTENHLLVVISLSVGRDLLLGDRLEFDKLSLDSDVTVTNATQGNSFVVRITAGDVHDLRLPADHRSSRTPTEARLRGD